MNVVSLFLRHADRAPAATALAWDDGSLTYGELASRARRMAQAIASRGVGVEDRVAILLPNDPAFAVALLGTLWHGALAAVLSPAWAPADAARALDRADARLLVTTSALAAAMGADPARTLLVDDAPELVAPSRPGVRGRAPAPRDWAQPATVLFSSGTTGDPKGVVLTHGNLAFNARAKIRYCGIAPADRLALAVPMSHCFGQNVVLLGALLAGASVRIYPRFHAAEVARDIRAGAVTMLLAAPTAFERLLTLGDERALRTLRYALTAAAPPARGLSARWRAASGRALAQGYGLTECSPFATYEADPGDDDARVGRAIDGVEVRIAGATPDEWVPAGTAGEIAIRGANVMAGYWRNDAATARTLAGGWLRTGDVGVMDVEGTVHLINRLDDVINVAGFKAWPSDVERALAAHPDVADVAAYAAPDELRGAAVAAAVVLRAGASVTLDEIARHAAERLAGFQRPTQLHVVHALPLSASGKVLRRELPGALVPRRV